MLVTDPATLLPRRMVWTRSVRLGGAEREATSVEQVDRREYDFRYPEPAPAAAPKQQNRMTRASRRLMRLSSSGESVAARARLRMLGAA